MVTSNNEKEREKTYPLLAKEMSSKKKSADPAVNSKSGPLSPTYNKRKPSLIVVDTKDDTESERNYGTNRVSTPSHLIPPASSVITKLITNVRSSEKKACGIDKQRLHTYQTSAKYGITSPKSKPNIVIDTKDNTTAGNFYEEQSPRVSQSLFKVGLPDRSSSTDECGDYHEEQQNSPAEAFSKLKIGHISLTSEDKNAARVSNFIDSLHQKRGFTSTPRDAGNNTHLPPTSPSVARLAANNKYSSTLSNARSVIASSPVSLVKAAAVSNGSPPSGFAVASRKSFLQKSAGRYNALDSDSSDNSDSTDGDSSYSNETRAMDMTPDSTQKDVGDFIDTLKRKNEQKVKKDMELLSSLKDKLDTRKTEKETVAKKNLEMLSSFKAQLGAQVKTKSEPSATEEKKDEPAEVAVTPQDDTSTHNIKKDVNIMKDVNIKKDVNYYAILSQIQKAVQSDNPSLMMGRILADAGKRGMKLEMVTKMIREEKLKAKACKPETLETGAAVEKETPKKNAAKACELAKEQLAIIKSKVDQSVEKAEAIQKKQYTTDIDTRSVAQPSVSVSRPKAQTVSSINSTSSPKTSSALMAEVEARIKEVVRSATPSIEFGKILADAKRKGLPTSHLIRWYKQERDELTNAAVKAASLVIKPEDNEVSSSRPKDIEVDNPPKSSADVSMKEKFAKEVQNAVRSSSNPPELLGKILAEAKSKGMPTGWLFELYTKERMQMQTVAAKEQGTKHPVNEICPSESEVSDISVGASSNVVPSPAARQVTNVKGATDVDDFFSKFSLHAESKETNMDIGGEKQDLTSSVSEVSEIVELNEEISRESQELELSARTSTSANLCEVEVTVSTSSKDSNIENKVHSETAYVEKENIGPAMKRVWKSPLCKERLSRRTLSKGGKSNPINGVTAVAALSQKRRLRGPRRTHLTQSTQERTKEHRGFLDIDFYSLYEATTCHAEDEEIDKAPWEYRGVRQRFLSDKSVESRNWFGSFESKRGNDRISNSVSCPKSLQIAVTKIPESGDWDEDWYTTWKSRRENPNNLVTFTEADIPSLSMNSTGTSSTSTTMTGSRSYDSSEKESANTEPFQKKTVLIEIGNIVSVRFGGERVSKVHPDYTSSLRRSRWRKKYMRGEFAFDAEL